MLCQDNEKTLLTNELAPGIIITVKMKRRINEEPSSRFIPTRNMKKGKERAVINGLYLVGIEYSKTSLNNQKGKENELCISFVAAAPLVLSTLLGVAVGNIKFC